MHYFVCTQCPHNTLDHEMYGPRACLLCNCKRMENGAVFVKKEYRPVPGQKAKPVFPKEVS